MLRAFKQRIKEQNRRAGSNPVFLSLFLILFSLQATTAFANKYIENLVHETEDIEKIYDNLVTTLSQDGHDGAARLDAMIALKRVRKDIEANAYKTTMMLCEGYRRVRGMGSMFKSGKYYYSKARALGAWGSLVGNGMLHLVDSDTENYNLAYGREWYDWHRLYNTATVFYLLQSDGFFKASLHCLWGDEPMPDRDEMEAFARAIILTNGIGSQGTLALVGNMAFKAILKVWSATLGKLGVWGRLGESAKQAWQLKKVKVVTIAGASTLVMGGVGGIYYYIQKMKRTEKEKQIGFQKIKEFSQSDEADQNLDHSEDWEFLYSQFMTLTDTHMGITEQVNLLKDPNTTDVERQEIKKNIDKLKLKKKSKKDKLVGYYESELAPMNASMVEYCIGVANYAVNAKDQYFVRFVKRMQYMGHFFSIPNIDQCTLPDDYYNSDPLGFLMQIKPELAKKHLAEKESRELYKKLDRIKL